MKMMSEMDAIEYYLNKYLDELDRCEVISERFDEAIKYDLEKILKHCESIKDLALSYENEYNLDFNAKELIIQFISDNL
jgi:hypothetical protein